MKDNGFWWLLKHLKRRVLVDVKYPGVMWSNNLMCDWVRNIKYGCSTELYYEPDL